jgi:hypothetical protein
VKEIRMERYDIPRGPPNPLVVGLVSAYLLLVGSALIVLRAIPSGGLLRILTSALHRPYRGELSGLRPEQGHCFLAQLPAHLLSDSESASRLHLYEDERELGPPHSAHDDIRAHGAGRFSHWGPQLYFSTSDNSDPRVNGRRYRIVEGDSA